MNEERLQFLIEKLATPTRGQKKARKAAKARAKASAPIDFMPSPDPAPKWTPPPTSPPPPPRPLTRKEKILNVLKDKEAVKKALPEIGKGITNYAPALAALGGLGLELLSMVKKVKPLPVKPGVLGKVQQFGIRNNMPFVYNNPGLSIGATAAGTTLLTAAALKDA